MKWNTVKEFADWYVANNFPIRPPFDGPVYVTSISYSYVLYREGQYQAELYLVKPNAASPDHSHPKVENIIMVLGGAVGGTTNGKETDNTTESLISNLDGTSKLFKGMSETLTDKDVHSLTTGDTGGAFISFEKWPEDIKPYSVTENWEGASIDSDHIIRKVE
jgi:quercetin dioxygenase-like cupin family protein